jgi:uncharacterized membrane protein YbhN (UPF0104 family)
LKTNRKKLLSTFIKIAISIFLLYFVFTKISIGEILETIRGVNPYFLILSIICFLLSQWISAKRLLIIFHEVGFNLSKESNSNLYLIGMFYNFFIPGGIGGDAYKVFILNKKFKWEVKTLTSAVFVDRFIGLTAIGILISLLAYNSLPYRSLFWLIPISIVIIIGTSFIILKHFLPKFLNVYSRTLIISILVQLLQIASVVFIIMSLDNHGNYINYILIFLISSVLSIFSLSGIGIREYIFYEASLLLEIDSSVAVTIGLIFSIITAMISLFGIVFHFKNYKLNLVVIAKKRKSL